MRLRGENLTCIRGERGVFANLSFEVRGGEALAVTGRNGSGKSSLLRMLAGLLPAVAGQISFEDEGAGNTSHLPLAGRDRREAPGEGLLQPEKPQTASPAAPHPDPLPVRTGRGNDDVRLAERAHYLGHRDALKPQLSVRENLSFWQDFLGDSQGDANDTLARAGLGNIADLPAAFLSAGQRRRLSIARLIVVKRPVWLLDEPSSALDDAGQAMLVDAMSAHLASGGLIVAATHAPLGLAQSKELKLGMTSGVPA